jgi:hypothetical protein
MLYVYQTRSSQGMVMIVMLKEIFSCCTGEPDQLGPAGGLHCGGGLHRRCSRHLLRPNGRHSGAQNIRQSTILGFCTFNSMAREPLLIFFNAHCQCCGSGFGSGLDSDLMGTRRAKMTHKNKININKFHF